MLIGGSGLSYFFGKDAVEDCCETMPVGNDLVKNFQFRGIVAPWYPYLEIALGAILVGEVANRAFEMTVVVEIGVVGEPVLDCPAYDRVGVDEAIGLSDDKPVVAAGLAPVGCAMVLDRIAHYIDLFVSEARSDETVGKQYRPGITMVVLSAVDQTEVMERCDEIDHVDVERRHMPCEFEALADDHSDMIFAVSLIEARIPWYDVCLDIFDDFRRYLFCAGRAFCVMLF